MSRSSSARAGCGAWAFNQAVAQLPPALASRVIGATFDAKLHSAGFASSRSGGTKCKGMRKHKRLGNWIAVDDDARDWPEEDLDRLVHTDTALGLSEPGALKRLAAWLER